MINLLNLFFPKVCEACSRYLSDNEQVICSVCRHELPVTNIHFTKNEAVKKVLFGRVKLEEATSLFYFSKGGLVQRLLHNLKYRGHEHIGQCFGEWLGEELKDSENFNGIDTVVPVPLHPKKLRLRGYNQVDKFGKAIANALEVPFQRELLKKRFTTKTQVFKNRIGRYDDSKTKFYITNNDKFSNHHVLIVDDIITTGSTIENCSQVLQAIPGIKLSLATMAIAE